jgi:hypothetical protein
MSRTSCCPGPGRRTAGAPHGRGGCGWPSPAPPPGPPVSAGRRSTAGPCTRRTPSPAVAPAPPGGTERSVTERSFPVRGSRGGGGGDVASGSGPGSVSVGGGGGGAVYRSMTSGRCGGGGIVVGEYGRRNSVATPTTASTAPMVRRRPANARMASNAQSSAPRSASSVTITGGSLFMLESFKSKRPEPKGKDPATECCTIIPRRSRSAVVVELTCSRSAVIRMM